MAARVVVKADLWGPQRSVSKLHMLLGHYAEKRKKERRKEGRKEKTKGRKKDRKMKKERNR